MKNYFHFLAIGLFFSTAAEATLINIIAVTGAQFNSLTQQSSINPNVPSEIVGDLRLANLNGANATFLYQDSSTTPASHLLGGAASGGQQIRISNNSGVAWTDFHFELNPNSVVTFDILSALVIAPAGNTAITITNSTADIVFRNPIASGGMFTFKGLGLDIPTLCPPPIQPGCQSSGATFSMIMRPTFVPEPSSSSLVIFAGILLQLVFGVRLGRTQK